MSLLSRHTSLLAWLMPKAKSERMKPGPKPRGGVTSKLIALRVTPDEHSRYQIAAEAASKTLSEWLRAAAEAAIPKRKAKG